MGQDEFFDDLANAIGMLRRAFLKQGLEPPRAIELGSHDAGVRFQCSLPRGMMIYEGALNQRDKAEPDILGHFMGVEIRYPAKLRGRKNGGADFDDGVSGRAFYSLDGTRIR